MKNLPFLLRENLCSLWSFLVVSIQRPRQGLRKPNPPDRTAQHLRTWYGLSAEVVIEGDYWHWVRLGFLPIPHPPLINLFLRRGLPPAEKRKLSYWHELGHLQTVPWAFLLAAIYLGMLWWRAEIGGSLLWRGMAALIGHEAIWELGAEGYVIRHMGRQYWQIYEQRGDMISLAAFWFGLSLLAIITTWYIVGWG
ncbi:MAG: hypothetical protein D6736_17945 [Nitrospinota bacterium]|nr:MAG: hypothetical protein D6736_17945 [Nitrospinota bacterium]